ncbi:MAG: hypothetical protein LIV24_06165 [Eubacterium sp.]|nr:hypothetical protein [Eubacterium sp.]
MAESEELFKTTAFGGYDKDDVQAELQRLKDNAFEEKTKISKELANARKALDEKDAVIREKDARIEELQEDLNAKDKEILKMEKTIREKYQSYVDNYDTIGSLIYEAKIRAKQIDRETESEKQRRIAQAEADAQKIRDQAQEEAQKTLDGVQKQIDDMNREGKQQYNAVQEELSQVVEIFNRVQKQFMNSYKAIQDIVNENAGTGECCGSSLEDDDYEGWK